MQCEIWKNYWRITIMGILLALTLVPQSVWAEPMVPLSAPNSSRQSILKAADPARAQQRLLTPRVSPKIKPKEPIPQIPEVTSTLPGKIISFKLHSVIITGATSYKKTELAKIYAPYLGKKISLQDLRALVQTITNRYHKDGYFLSRAILPPQKINRGMVQIHVVEGYISQVNVKGASSALTKLLEAYAKNLTRERPLKFTTLERYVLLANDIPGVDISSVLKSSANVQGSAELNLLVKEEQRFGGGLGVNNLGTRYLGPIQQDLGVYANSMFTPGDSTSLRAVVTSPTRELNFYELSHSAPVGSNGARVTAGASYTESMPGFILTSADVRGQSKAFYLSFNYPALRSRAKNFSFLATFNYIDSKTTLLGEPYYHDKLRTLELGGVFDTIDSWRGVNIFSLIAERGLTGLGANDATDLLSRPDARIDFTKLTAYLVRLQTTSTPFSFLLGLKGQYAFSPVLASEEFGFGGADFGRGYDPSEIIGDRGVTGKAEIRFDQILGRRMLKSIRYYAFYDAGIIWNYGLYQPERESATSVGFGLSINFNKYLKANTYVARPLTLPVATEVAANQDGHKVRFFFQLAAAF